MQLDLISMTHACYEVPIEPWHAHLSLLSGTFLIGERISAGHTATEPLVTLHADELSLLHSAAVFFHWHQPAYASYLAKCD